MIALLRKLFLHDFWLKLFSLVLAVLVWITIWLAIHKDVSPAKVLTAPSEEQTFFNLPVVVMSSASDVHDFKVSPKTAAVTLRGDPRLLEHLQPQDIRVIVDLTGIEAARLLRKRIEVFTRPGITLVRLEPDEVQVIYPAKG